MSFPLEVYELAQRVILYGATFAISLFLVNRADRAYDRNKTVFFVCSLCAILIPCCFAAIRSETVGTDVLVYAKPCFQLACSIGSIEQFLQVASIEAGYAVVVFVVAKLLGTIEAVLFFTEFIIIVPVYAVAVKFRKLRPMWLTMLAYFALFFGASFNFMRQSMAAAMLLLAFVNILDSKWMRGILLAALAQLFHNTAIMGMVMIAVVFFLYNVKNVKTRNTVLVLVFAILIVGVSNWSRIVTWAVYDLKLFPERFMVFVSIFAEGANADSLYLQLSKSNYVEMFFRIICLVLPWVFLRKKSGDNRLTYAVGVMSLMAVSLYVALFLIYHTSYAVRVTWYAEFFFILWLPLGCTGKNLQIRDGKFGISVPNLCTICFLVAYWLIGYMILGWHGTLPFSLKL